MVDFQHVYMSYNPGDELLVDVNFHVDKGEFVYLMGRSGAGKSTVLRLLLKELDANSGSITVNETELNTMKTKHIPTYRRQVGMVFQDFRLLPDRTVYENIAFPLEVIGKPRKYIKEHVRQLSRTVNLENKLNSRPGELSGGEQQRVAIARALATSPPIILADEPTGNLDPLTSVDIMQCLEDINKQGITIIMATHDMDIVKRFPRNIINMDNGHTQMTTRGGDNFNGQFLPIHI